MWVCVRLNVAYSLSFRNIEETMAERAVWVDHLTLRRWAIKSCRYSPVWVVGASVQWETAGGWTKPTSRSQANGSAFTAP